MILKNPKVDLRLKYPKIFESSLIASILLTTVLIRFGSFETSGILAETPEIQIDMLEINRTEQIKRPPPPSRPAVPIASEDEELLEDETIEDTEINLDEIPPPPPPPKHGDNVEKKESQIFIAYETEPKLIGGYAFIRENLKYPDMARKAQIEGTVLLQIVIDEQGNVVDANVLKEDANVGFGQAAIDVVMKTKWEPALQRDQPVKVRITIPIKFKLK